MMKRTVTLLFLVLCSISSLYATEIGAADRDYIIKGTVKNRQDEPIPYATVMVTGTNIGMAANVEGKFQIKLNRGNYKLRISCTGYEPRTVEVDAVKEPELDIVLDEAKNNLTEVVVTGTRSEKMLKDEPVVTRVITAEDIKKIDPQDFKSLLEYELPGLHFDGAAHGSGLPAISFQGMDSRYLLFLIDGERIAGEGALDNVDFSRLNVDNIERIEIVKSAMSTLYGSNALGGVINIITKKANRPFVGTVSTRLTSRKDRKYTVSLGTRQEKFSSLTTASFSRRDPFTFEEQKPTKRLYELPDGRDSIGVNKKLGKLNMRGYETFSIAQKLGYDFTDKLSAELNVGFYQNKLLYIKEGKISERFRDFTFGGKVNYIFNENSRLDLSYHYDNYFKDDIDSADHHKTKIRYRDILNNVRLNYSLLLAEHSLTVGSEVNAEKLRTNWFKDTTANSITNYVLYVQDDYRITDRLTLVGGVRMDYHSLYKVHVSPKLSAMYKVGNVTLRGGYAAGFRSPSMKELYGEFSHGRMFKIYGSTDLKPETSHHVSLSGEWTAGIFNISATGYYNWFNKRIAMQQRISENKKQKYPDFVYANADSAKTYGADINMQIRLPFDLTLKGTYSYVYDDTKIKGRRSSYVRPHTAVMQAEYSRKFGNCRATLGLNGRWMSGVDYWATSYVSKKRVFTKLELNDYMIWKLNASCRFPRGVTLNIGIDNLFNTKDDNFSDLYAIFSRGTEFVANLSVNIAELIGK
ncbi:TonB-dependent receptor [Tannerella forsythia]|uniref:TonB-dependent receptor n=1 Tax=Tannerella forsythia TaxID=28112 RepID=UPI000B234B7D|nr:TonB-dependent receptor [Tannerella forsythia]